MKRRASKFQGSTFYALHEMLLEKDLKHCWLLGKVPFHGQIISTPWKGPFTSGLAHLTHPLRAPPCVLLPATRYAHAKAFSIWI